MIVLGVNLMTQKYVMGTPLYRMEADFKRSGYPLSRQTIAISFDDGTIHFIDHENELNPLLLANDFKSFLKRVESKPIDPKHLKSIEDREAELIRRGRGAIITDLTTILQYPP